MITDQSNHITSTCRYFKEYRKDNKGGFYFKKIEITENGAEFFDQIITSAPDIQIWRSSRKTDKAQIEEYLSLNICNEVDENDSIIMRTINESELPAGVTAFVRID